MARRPLRVEQALEFLPNLDELRPLRLALLRTSGDSPAAGRHGVLETRSVSIDELRRRAASIAASIREHAERSTEVLIGGLAALAAGDFAAAAAALVRSGELHEDAGLHVTAMALYERALEMGAKARDRSGEALALRRIAWLRKERGELEAALSHYRALRQLAAAIRDIEGEVVACQGLGNVLVDQGRWEEARQQYEAGLRLLESDSEPRLRWQLYNNLSIVARRTGDLDAAPAWLASARAVVEAGSEPDAAVYLANAAGMIAMAAGEPAAAEAHYREALTHAPAPGTRATILINLADALFALGRIAGGEAAAREVEAIALAQGLAVFLPHAYRALGAAARARLDEDGFVFFAQALQLCEELGSPPFETAVTHFEYASFEAALGRLEAARARFAIAERIFAEIGAEPDRLRVVEAVTALRSATATDD